MQFLNSTDPVHFTIAGVSLTNGRVLADDCPP